MKIRAAGFSGIVATTWDDGVSMTNDRSVAGDRCVVTSRRSNWGASRSISTADVANDRRCSIGRTIAGRSDPPVRLGRRRVVVVAAPMVAPRSRQHQSRERDARSLRGKTYAAPRYSRENPELARVVAREQPVCRQFVRVNDRNLAGPELRPLRAPDRQVDIERKALAQRNDR